MKTKTLCGLAAVIAMGGAVAASAVSAAPIGTFERSSPAASTQIDPVHYRGGRYHCHWRDGRKWCNGGYSRRSYGPGYGYYGYNRRPGVNLYLNFGGNRHNRWR